MTEYRGQGTADTSTATTISTLRETATATSGQTVFNLSTALYTPSTNELSVYVDGLKQVLTTEYVETSTSVVTFVSGLTTGQVVEFVAEVGGTSVDTTDATKSVFTHDNTGATQTTVDVVLKALAVDLTADLKTVAGAEAQTAYVRGRDTAGDGYSGFYYWDSTSTATDTSATTTLVVQQNGVATGRWLKNTFNTFSGDVLLGGDVEITGTTESTSTSTGSLTTDGGLGVVKNAVIGQDLVLGEQADHSSTPGNGYGYIWVKTGAPSTLFFTDDAGADTDLTAAGATVSVADETTDTTCFPLFSTAATGALSAKSNTGLTFNSATSALTATSFVGPLTGNADTATTAATVTDGAQTNITSVGTLTSLDVDNIRINGNDISSTGGTDLTITPLAGQQIVLDGAIVVDAGVVTGATSVTSTNFVGAVDGVLGGVTPAAASVTTLAINGDITTDADGTDSIGATAKRFLKGWFDSLTVTGDVGAATGTFTGEVTGAGFTGTLDGVLGGGTPAAASVTTLNASGTITGDVTGDVTGALNGILGGVTPAAATVTTLNASSDITLADNAAIRFGTSGAESEIESNGTRTIWNCKSNKDLYITDDATNRFAFDVSSGNFHATGDVFAATTFFSDPRLKHDIVNIDSALDKVNQLNGVTFVWNKDEKVDAGLISTDVEAVLPEAIRYSEQLLDDEDDTVYQAVNYNAVIGLLVEAVKELTEKVKKLEEV